MAIAPPPPENLGIECPSAPLVVYTDVGVVPEHEEEEAPEPALSALQAEVSALRLRQRNLHAQRRGALDKILDIKGSIRVFCRARPVDVRRLQPSPVSFREDRVTVRSVGGARKEFAADRLFAQEATQEEVFHEVEPMLRSALDGHNVCVFAYGQTGTGKTFTMEGTGDRPGIVPRSVEELFRQASRDRSASFDFSMSMLEVYMGSLRDLLAHRPSSSRAAQYSTPSCNLSILSGSNGSVEVEGLTDVSVADFKQAYRWYAKGKRARSTSWTNVNETSSRSHCFSCSA